MRVRRKDGRGSAGEVDSLDGDVVEVYWGALDRRPCTTRERTSDLEPDTSRVITAEEVDEQQGFRRQSA